MLLKNNPVKISIKCNECDFTGENNEVVRVHKITECSEALILRLTEEGPLNNNDSKCGLCNFQSKNRVLRNDHRDNVHPGFKCARCGNITPNMDSFRRHMKKHELELKKGNVSYPGNTSNFKCTPCKLSFKSHDKLMSHLSEVHITEAERTGAGAGHAKHHNVQGDFQNYSSLVPCRNGNQCRFHRKDRCYFLHDSPPQEQQDHHLWQSKTPSSQWKTVPYRQHYNNEGYGYNNPHERQAQGHRYWSIPPLNNTTPWCKHGNNYPMGKYCVLRHEGEQDFSSQFPHRGQ